MIDYVKQVLFNKLREYQNLSLQKRWERILKSGHIRCTESPVVIFSEPRGGSTWLAELLLQDVNTLMCWEPLRPFRLQEIGLSPLCAEMGGFTPYIPRDAEWGEVHAICEQILNGSFPNWKCYLRNDMSNAVSTKRMLVKFVTANMLMHWFAANFKEARCIYLVRNPFSVVASMCKHRAFSKTHAQFEFPTSRYTDLFDKHKDYLGNIDHPVQNLAAQWCIKNVSALAVDLPINCITVYYEHLVVDTKKEMERICRHTGIHFSAIDPALFSQPSSTTVDASFLTDVSGQLSKWREQLDEQEIAMIQDCLNHFGITVYSKESSMPLL